MTVARRLVSVEGAQALELASQFDDLDALATGTALRKHFDAELAAAAITQVALRRRAAAKFGDRAHDLYFTRDGLEQASRWRVAQWRAQRFQQAGAQVVVDLGCGIGADVLALRDTGLQVLPVEKDRSTAVFAQANLGIPVVVADATENAPEDWIRLAAKQAQCSPQQVGLFCDPARRTERGRTWRLADLSPSWEYCSALLQHVGPVCLKLGPGIAHSELPVATDIWWVSESGDLVEASVWRGGGTRAAILLPEQTEYQASDPVPIASGIGIYIWEADPAIIRARALGTVAQHLGARQIAESIAYLTGDCERDLAGVQRFRILRQLPYRGKDLRAWVRETNVGTLEIKTRGLDLDPEVLRRTLKPRGTNAATIICTRGPKGSVTLVVERT